MKLKKPLFFVNADTSVIKLHDWTVDIIIMYIITKILNCIIDIVITAIVVSFLI